MKSVFAAVALACALAPGSVAAASEESADDVRFVGTPVTGGELDDSDKRAAIATSEFLYFMKHKKYECRQGALAADYSSGDGFVFEDATLSADQVVAELAARRGKGEISCFFVESAVYDRALFARLETAMAGGSLWWNEPGKSPE